MPETRGGEAGAANVFYALGEEAGMGFSPFAIEDETDPKGALAASYHAIASLAPMLLEHQSAGDLHGFVLDRNHPSVDFTIGGYTVARLAGRDLWRACAEWVRADLSQRAGRVYGRREGIPGVIYAPNRAASGNRRSG